MSKTPPKEPARLSRATIAIVWLSAAAGTILVLLLAAGSAEGGTYRAAQCHAGLGAGRGDFAFERNSDHYVSDADCDGRGLAVRHSHRSSARDRWGAWLLPVPKGLLLTSFKATVAGTAEAGHTPELFAGLDGGGDELGRVTGDSHPVSWHGSGIDGLQARLRCARSECGEGRRAKVRIRRLALRLLDETEPTAELDGPLASGVTQRGVTAMEAVASDVGSGVRRIHLEINGKPVTSRRVPCELRRRIALRLRPCPANTAKPYELDTEGRVFQQGLNRIRVCVDDYATTGDRNRACARHKARVDNECPVDDASEAGVIQAGISGGRRADQPSTLTGTLTDTSGDPIRAARVCIATRTNLGDAAERVIATPRTGAAGRFEARLEAGPSREVRVAHWAGTSEVAERYLDMQVRARPGLRIGPDRTLRNGESARFVVRLNQPEAAEREVHLQAKVDGRWVVIRAHRASRKGIWRDSYRFTSTTGERTYRFRALVKRQRGYPYLRGTSRVREVTVRG